MNGIITRNVIRVVFIVAILFSIVGCSDNDDNNTTPSLTSTNVVEVVFSPSGFGDLGYNDIILTGLEESRKRLGFDLIMHVPASVEDGIAIYNKWAQKTAKDERRLFIFASNQYESALRNSSVRPSDANSSVLLYETHKPIDGVYTFRIGMYGAAYLIGAYTALTNKDESDYKAAVLAANPFDRNVDGAGQVKSEPMGGSTEWTKTITQKLPCKYGFAFACAKKPGVTIDESKTYTFREVLSRSFKVLDQNGKEISISGSNKGLSFKEEVMGEGVETYISELSFSYEFAVDENGTQSATTIDWGFNAGNGGTVDTPVSGDSATGDAE